MSEFMLSERYRLELHWQTVSRPEPGVMTFKGAYFSGPVLSQAVRLNNNDTIRLDFCEQKSIIVHNIYVADFSWGKVTYKDKIILLDEAAMVFDPELENVPNLGNTDYLVIDTKNHETSKHAYHLLYPAYVVNLDKELYDYRK